MEEVDNFRILESDHGITWTEVDSSSVYMHAYHRAKDRSSSRKETYQRIIGLHVGGKTLITFKNGTFAYNSKKEPFDGPE